MSEIFIIALGNPTGSLRLEMGEERTKVSGAGAKWTEVDRPRRKGLSQYDGEALGQLTLPVMLNGWPYTSIEWQIEELERWKRRFEGEPTPTRLRVFGPIPHPELEYVLTDLDWGDRAEWLKDGRRCRQDVTLALMEFSPADLIVQHAPGALAAQARAAATAAPARTYVVKQGDSLWTIAGRELRNADRWREVADLNGIRDPKRLQVGMVLRLP